MTDSTVIIYRDQPVKKKSLVLPMNYNPERLVRKDEAMFLFGCMPESTFDDYRKKGLIPHGFMLGSVRVWKMSEIQAAIANIGNAGTDEDAA